LDFFDASINRVAAWVVGISSFRKALLSAMLTPNAYLTELQNKGEFTKLMVMQEQAKMLPIDAVWTEFCERCGVISDEKWFDEVEKYEKEVLLKRN
ncbi:MAG: L-rhamnose isomerase, partial [Clostridia bacterium]|nr:L-rhamnose isomerase [Clostridia bacterium]